MENCLFCKFVSGELKTEIVYSDDDFIIFKDIAPQAKNHYLAVMKKHFKYISEMSGEDATAFGNMLRKIS
ncbi:MAG: HIT domain-containing protein, partial [Clostridia bacterium]|nr:HIT domain-containing protein [Clostridia bacterium]